MSNYERRIKDRTEGPVNSVDQAADLRRRAEEYSLRHPPPRVDEVESGQPPEALKSLHELRVHQIELELQNEELRRVQEELDSSRVRYFNLYDLAPVAYLTLNRQSRILEANSTGARLLGVPRSGLVARSITDFILPADQDLFYFSRTRLYESGEPQSVELQMRKPDGAEFWVHLEATVEFDGEGEPKARLVLSDITEHRRILALLHQSQKMESLEVLASGVAHDMNNVLGAILGLASVHAELQPPGSPAKGAFETIRKACDRGGALVRSLMGFARHDLAEEKELDLNGLIRDELGLLMRTTLPGVHFVQDLAEDLWPIRGDRSALTHALVDLCLNASDAMPEDGTVTVRSRNLGAGGVELQVIDTGTGMSAGVLEKALDPFFTTKPQGKGTGMGLSTAHSTVLAHHGEMELYSQPGHGTRIVMRFPASKEGIESQEPALEGRVEPSTRHLDILVVDDDDLVQTSMREMLEALGHQVVSAMCGEEALERLESGYEPDVAILDMNMPGLGGAGTLPRLHELRPALPVVITTGRTDKVVRDLVSTHPYVTQLPKPFGVTELRKHIDLLQHE